MIEVSYERFAELIVAEHNYRKLCRIISERVDKGYGGLEHSELQLLEAILCIRKREADRE